MWAALLIVAVVWFIWKKGKGKKSGIALLVLAAFLVGSMILAFGGGLPSVGAMIAMGLFWSIPLIICLVVGMRRVRGVSK